MKRGAVLIFSLIVMAVAGIVIGYVGSYYVNTANLIKIYRTCTTDRFTAEHAVESVVAEVAGLVVDPISKTGQQLADKATNFEQLKTLLANTDESSAFQRGNSDTERVATFKRGTYTVKTSFDIAELDTAVDVGDDTAADDHRYLTIEAVVYNAGGIEVSRVKQVLQIDLVRIGVAKKTTLPVFDYVYFANNYGRLSSEGIRANGDVGSNDRMTIEGARVNGYVWAHAPSAGASADSVISLVDAYIWPYATYMKRITTAYKTEGHNYYTQVRPTNPNRFGAEKLDWEGGFAYPPGSDDKGEINDDGTYIPVEYPDMANQPQLTDYTGSAICPTPYADTHEKPSFTKEEPKLDPCTPFSGGPQPTVTPATRPTETREDVVLPEVKEPKDPGNPVADPGPDPLKAFLDSYPDINNWRKTTTYQELVEDGYWEYYWSGWSLKRRWVDTSYYVEKSKEEFLYDSYVTTNQAWATTTFALSWQYKSGKKWKSWTIPNVKNSSYYKNGKVQSDKFYDDDYQEDIEEWYNEAKNAYPNNTSTYKNTIYDTWKEQYDKYQVYYPIYTNYTAQIDKYVAYTNSLQVWADIEALQKSYDETSEALSDWKTQYTNWYNNTYTPWVAESNNWVTLHATWVTEKTQYESELKTWTENDTASKKEIATWLANSNTWQTAWNEWNAKYEDWQDEVDAIKESVNNGSYEVPLTTQLQTQNAYWDDVAQTTKSKRYIVTCSTNYVDMPNLSRDNGDYYRMYCQTNWVIMTNAFGVATKEQGGKLVCRNWYVDYADSSKEKEMSLNYAYNEKIRTISDADGIWKYDYPPGTVLSEEIGDAGTFTRKLTDVNISKGWQGGFYPFQDSRLESELGSVILIGTANYPITINGPVYFDNDVIIRGFVSGQGTIYAGRNIHIIGDITYLNPPSWPHSDTSDAENDPRVVKTNNANRDLLMLMARGNIVIGDYTKAEWATSFTNWMKRAASEGGSSLNLVCNQMDDQKIGYPSDLSAFGRNYGDKEETYGSNGWDGGYKTVLGYVKDPNKATGTGHWSWRYIKCKYEYYCIGASVQKGVRFYESKLGDNVLSSFMQSSSSSSASGWSSSILQSLIWKWRGYDNTTVNTTETSFDYSQTSSAISSNGEAGDITKIDASLFANHGIFGMVGGSVSKKFTLNGGIVCRDEGLLSTMEERIPGAEAWLNYDLRLKSDSAEGNSVVAPTFSTSEAARTELKVSLKAWMQN